MTKRTAYTSTVTAWPTAAGATVVALTIGAVAVLAAGPTAIGFAITLGAIAIFGGAAAVHLATVRLVVSAVGAGVGAGIRGRTRRIPADWIVDSAAVQFRWPQVFGLGLPVRWRTTRLTVRPGPTLALHLTSGERIWVSTPDPTAAAALLGRGNTDKTREIA